MVVVKIIVTSVNKKKRLIGTNKSVTQLVKVTNMSYKS